MKQLIRTEGQEHFFKCMLLGGTRKQKLREQYKIDMYICIHTHKYKLHIYFLTENQYYIKRLTKSSNIRIADIYS